MSDINSLTQQDLKKLEMLREMQLPCHDDNKRFTDTAKLDKIHELLHSSSYMPVNGNNLYSLWGKVSLDHLTPEQRESMIVISTHVDMVSEITTPFVEFYKDGTMKGTFDNTATNAAIVYQMLYALCRIMSLSRLRATRSRVWVEQDSSPMTCPSSSIPSIQA